MSKNRYDLFTKPSVAIIKINIEGEMYPFVLDTGSTCSDITPSMAQKFAKHILALKFRDQKVDDRITDVADGLAYIPITTDDMKVIFAFRISELDRLFDDMNNRYGIRPIGIIGNDFLDVCDVKIDYGDKSVEVNY